MSDAQYELEAIRDMISYPKGTKIIYTGSLRNKPKGWRVVRQIRGRS
jgi:hypothetical protein